MLKNTIAFAGLGLASAKRGELFLSDSDYQRQQAFNLRNEIAHSIEQLEGEADSDAVVGYEVDNNCLRTPSGSVTTFFNLKPLEQGAGPNLDEEGNQLAQTDGDIFNFKICQFEYNQPDDITNSTELAGYDGTAIAFWAKNITGDTEDLEYELEKTFKRPIWNTIQNEDLEYTGLFVEWNAEQNHTSTDELCENGPDKVRLEVTCNEDVEDITWTQVNSAGCERIWQASASAGCVFLDGQAQLAPFAKFAGAIMIVIGAAMCFYGAKFILWVIGFLIFASIQGFFLSISYSLSLVDPVTLAKEKEAGGGNSLGIAIGIAIVGIIVGGVASYYLTKFANKFAVPIIAFGTAAIAVFMLTKPIIRHNTLVQSAIVLIAAGFAAWFSNRVQRYIKTIGTAIIGAFLLARGVGEYVGGFPKLLDKVATDGLDPDEVNVEDTAKPALAYLAAIIVLSVGGSFVQLKYTCTEVQDDDDMMNKDDA